MSKVQLITQDTVRHTSGLDFDLNEYNSRLNVVKTKMAALQLDLLVIDQFEHLVYLFGYLPTAAKYQACVLPYDGEPHMLVRGMDLPVFEHQSWVTKYTVFEDAEDPVAVLLKLIYERWGPANRIGLEYDSHLLTVDRYLRIAQGLPESKLVDFSGILAEQRLIKSTAEVGYHVTAALIADACMQAAIKSAAVGVSEREPAAAAYAAAMREGADNGRVLLSASGKLSNSIHGRLGQRVLQDGDVLHLEMVPQVHGYSSRLMRPVLLGSHNDSLARTARQLVAIQDEQMTAMKPGALASTVDAIARTQVLETGLRDTLPDHTGYTLGLHAQPKTSDHTRIFTPTANWHLQSGMVFHMFLSARGIAIGETVLITKSGAERLTQTPRDYFVR